MFDISHANEFLLEQLRKRFRRLGLVVSTHLSPKIFLRSDKSAWHAVRFEDSHQLVSAGKPCQNISQSVSSCVQTTLDRADRAVE